MASQTDQSKPDVTDDVQPNDSVSQIGTTTSSRSIRSLTAARLQQEQRSAELATRKLTLKKKHELEMAKLKLKLDEEELVLETDIAIANAKREVLDRYETAYSGKSVDDIMIQKPPLKAVNDTKSLLKSDALSVTPQSGRSVVGERYPPLSCDTKTDVNGAYANKMSSVLNPHVRDFKPMFDLDNSVQNNYDVRVNTVDDDVSRHGNLGYTQSFDHSVRLNNSDVQYHGHTNPEQNALFAVVRHLKRPVTEINKFSGDPFQYRKFIRQFITKVVNNTESADERMNYLDQFTAGEANKIVSGFGYLPAHKGYQAALNELEERYGNEEVMANAFIKKALLWQPVKADNPKAMDEFAIFLSECEHAVSTIQAVQVLEYADNMKRLVAKLPYYCHDKWRSFVYQIKSGQRVVKFNHLVKFVKDEAKKLNDPTYGREAMSVELMPHNKVNQRRPEIRKSKPSFATNMSESGSTGNVTPTSNPSPLVYKHVVDKSKSSTDSHVVKPCLYCASQNHWLGNCEKISTLTYADIVAFLRSKGVCFGCLKRGHMKKDCRYKRSCKLCNGCHPTLLHSDESIKQKSDSEDLSLLSACAEMRAGDGECTMAIIPVKVRVKNMSTVVETYAYLDPGSSISFCSEALMQKLGVKGKRMKITLETMGEPHRMETFAVDGFEICDLDMKNVVELPKMYTKHKMPVSHNHIPRLSDIAEWKHLKDVKLPEISSSIDILIGNNVPDAYTPLQIRTGPRGSPHATETRLGWIIWNFVRPASYSIPSDNRFSVNRAQLIALQELDEGQKLNQLVRDAINTDFPERAVDEKKEHSQDDQKFLSKVSKSIRKVGSHYEIGLPFRDQHIQLPNNELQAWNRLKSLERKLRKSAKFHEDYRTFMANMIEQGYAEEVPSADLDRNDGKVWFIPHHGIYHSKKPDKIRVVFDCTATYQGVSLNSTLLPGPDLTNNLLGVIIRFRQENIAIMADIEAMFYQVLVPKDDADCLRFYWWPGGDLDQEPRVYRMLVHLFGAVSSPSCANSALRRTADDNQYIVDNLATKVIKDNFYVDDCLASVNSKAKAIDLAKDITELCSKGGFHITKWISNDHDVLGTIPVEDRAKDAKLLNLECESLPNERALGVQWSVESDTFGFKIATRNCRPTRRTILSEVSSVYDPLGFAAPYVLVAKQLLQELCSRGFSWDEEVNGKDLLKWNEWVAELPRLETIKISRCYKPQDFGDFVRIEMHVFCDASNLGYGMVSYLRMIDDTERIHCSFLFAKSRVAPLKKTTIPRMELTAAVIAVRLGKMLLKELDYTVDNVSYWTDSTAVLKYIANEKTRFRTFVANRVTEIRELTDVHQWNYIDTKVNPADSASRGLGMDKFLQDSAWYSGPEFLWKKDEWPDSQEFNRDLSIEDPEVQGTVNVAVSDPKDTTADTIQQLIERFSDWNKLKRTVAWMFKGMSNLQQWVKHRKSLETQGLLATEVNAEMENAKAKHIKTSMRKVNTEHLEILMIEKAEMALVRCTQQAYFPNERKVLSCIAAANSKRPLLPKALLKLDPFLNNNILRVGGRLEKAEIKYDAKHPILLPKESPISRLIIEDCHRKVGHQGKNSMLAALRQKFWILGAGPIIKRTLSKCVLCRKYRACGGEQKMADLPEERLKSEDPPFTRVGVDYFGPIEVKRGRSIVKRYGVLFTCLAIRAVHLEVAYALDTDSCINALRRFISRRGQVKFIRSDNGTNFVGSERELREEITKWNQSKICKALQQRGITWEFNPPAGSHFGGVWERMIRSVRKILHALLKEQVIRLDDELLQTLFCEVEAIINGRPLAELTDDPNDLQALTPNHLLQLTAGETLPPGLFESPDNFAKRHWRQVQYLADIFWKRWKNEYLPLLQSRQKWNTVRRNLTLNDVVLLMDNSPRNSWSLGRVVETIKDRKGVVRMVKIQTKGNVLLRPIDKLCLVLEADI